MGATFIQLKFDGKYTREQVIQAVKERRDSDRLENGHQQGYSGDWQTIKDIRFLRDDKIFDDYNAARNYCSENSEKWHYGYAVKYKTLSDKAFNDIKSDKKMLKINERINEAQSLSKAASVKKQEFISEILTEAKDGKSKTIGCKECGSSFNRKLIKSMKCVMCGHDMTSDTNKAKIAKFDEKIEKIRLEIKSLEDQLAERRKELIQKSKFEVNWLVGGWAAE